MRAPTLLLIALATAGAARAQTVHVLPSGHGYETRFAGGTAIQPFGAGWSRALQVFDGATVPFGPSTVVELAWRRNDSQQSFQGTRVVLSARMGHTQASPKTLPYRFSAIRSPGEVTVFQGPLDLPAARPGPPTWSVRLPLTAPFRYDPASGNPYIDLEAQNGFGIDWRRDARQVFSGTPGTTTVFSPPCPNSMGFPMTQRVTTLEHAVPGRRLNVWVAGTRPDAGVVMHLLGSRRQQPLDLTSRGAPGCVLGIDPWFPLPTVSVFQATSSFGYAWADHLIPDNGALVGARFSTQWVELDTANPLGLVFSDAMEITLGRAGSFTSDVAMLIGDVQNNDVGRQRAGAYGAVTRFTVR